MYSHRYEMPRTQIPKPEQPFMKHLLKTLKARRPDHFRTELRVSPLTFDHLVGVIENDPVFVHHSEFSSKAPVEDTGCIEGFFEAENCKENAVESINTISLFCTLKKCN